MDNIYKFKASSSVGHLKSLNNDKQFYSEEESSKKEEEEKQLKKQSKPPSKMSQFSKNATGYQTDDSDKETPKNNKVGPSSQKVSKFRNLVNAKKIEGDNDDPNFDDDDDKPTTIQQQIQHVQQQSEDQYDVEQQASKMQQKYAKNEVGKSPKMKHSNTQQSVGCDFGCGANEEQIALRKGKLKNHPFRHLIYGPSIGENSFKQIFIINSKRFGLCKEMLKRAFREIHKIKNVVKAKTLLLDLDETLIHSCSFRENPQVTVTAFGEYGEEAKIHFNIRPFCTWFLQQMNQLYTIYVYTASSSAYANAIVNYLDPKRQWIMGILSRGNCMETKNGFFIKDLRIIGNKQLKDMVIVDNLAHSFGFQIENGIPILEWHNDQNDQELKYMATYLMEAAEQEDIRQFNIQRLKLDQLIEYNLD
ncbi:unnamed protein product (macronuclear) [Paramecium tetraurelia]|uniref:Mitochondrial import inner membrane translocase subunit TIM50 n=1 Tax=Paramecium tetraurelia TaxID=5888 RepID=A0CAT5_PARTE|nr:uncharacterized protein GSPATT00036683001 [Paramecium tetraurelia]CAK67902.1 unnamed protein product [Paramecium tetraurelia]|eukprot:XP_001435299.1 hypothetical protein (macronuclear) [Paramecium tetraurelia strain d4-2]